MAGTQIELTCPWYTQWNIIRWVLPGDPRIDLSENEQLLDSVPTELRPRMDITGNHTRGLYHLTIYDIKKTDERLYECNVSDHVAVYNLSVIGNAQEHSFHAFTQDDFHINFCSEMLVI